jgi:hypothetical protein
MKCAEIRAALSKEKEPETRAIFNVGIKRFVLCPSLTALFDEATDAVTELQHCWDFAEYLQLPKPLTVKVLQVKAAEQVRTHKSGFKAGYITNGPLFASLLKKAYDSSKGAHPGFDTTFRRLVARPSFLDGAFGVSAESATGGLCTTYETVFENSIYFLSGRAFAGHTLHCKDLALLKGQIEQYKTDHPNKWTQDDYIVPTDAIAAALMGDNLLASWQLWAIGFPAIQAFDRVRDSTGAALPNSIV